MIEFFKILYQNRKLAIQLGKNDFRNKFANTSLGTLWGFAQPFVFMITYVIVFQFILKTGSSGKYPYIVWFLPGMSMWLYISDAILSSSSSIRNYSYLVKKVVFPVDIIPIISIISSSYIGAFLVFISTMAATIFGFFPNILNIIYIVFCTLCLIVAITRFTSALVTVLPDFAQLLNIIIQLCMWFTPIVWNLSMLNGWMSSLFKLLPFTYIIEGFRQSFISTSTIITEHHFVYTISFWVITSIIFLWGNSIFKRNKKDFADVL